MSDFYEILGISRDAGKDEIKSAFRQKARQLHPDVNKEPDAADRFKELGRAYETLMDDNKRATYDRFGEDGLKNAGFDHGPFDGGFGGLDDIINHFMNGMFGGGFGYGTPDPNAPQRGNDLRLDIEIGFEEAVFGLSKEIKFDHLEECIDCKGSGAAPDSKPQTCKKCGGQGQVHHAIRTPLGHFSQIGICPDCQGKGQTISKPCKECNGAGKQRVERKLDVKIPAGVDNGSNMRLSGEGDAGSNGGPAGDLFVVIHVKQSDYFKRDGINVFTKLEITPAQAALGDEVTIKTLDGEGQIQIPNGIQTGQHVKIKNAGVPHISKPSHRGDHIVMITVKTPTSLSDEEKSLYQKLYEINTGKKPKKGFAWLPTLLAMLFLSLPASAVKPPENIQNYINGIFPGTYFRYDGLVVLPDSTVYLPVFPARILEPEKLEVINAKFNTKPNVAIFNSDFVLMKVVKINGNFTFAPINDVPVAVKSGLLPQDLILPPNFVFPDNLKIIRGNLEVDDYPSIRTSAMAGIKTNWIPIPNKNFYIMTSHNKNIQVNGDWAFAQRNLPITMQLYDDHFLLVTSYNKRSLDVISIQDESVIKQFDFKSNPSEIVLDKKNKLAYVSVPETSDIFVINLTSFTMLRQIKVAGMCEKLALSADGTKLFYHDKKTRDIMAVELDNEYLIRDLGRFPNVSKIVYTNDKVYLTSRTSNRLAIIDYATVGLLAEIEVASKPVDMLAAGSDLFVLSQGELRVLDTQNDNLTNQIFLNSNGFARNIIPAEGTDFAIITDAALPNLSVFNLKTKQIVKTGTIGTPVSTLAIGKTVKKIYD